MQAPSCHKHKKSVMFQLYDWSQWLEEIGAHCLTGGGGGAYPTVNGIMWLFPHYIGHFMSSNKYNYSPQLKWQNRPRPPLRSSSITTVTSFAPLCNPGVCSHVFLPSNLHPHSQITDSAFSMCCRICLFLTEKENRGEKYAKRLHAEGAPPPRVLADTLLSAPQNRRGTLTLH